MRRKRKQSNIVRNALIVVLVIVFIIVLAASYKSEQVNPQDEAKDYFEIFGADYFPFTGNSSTIRIMILGFNIRAVKGDAHNVQVRCLNSEWLPVETILKGQYVPVELELSPTLEFPAADEFPITISVSSTEASGSIAITLKKN